MATQDSIVSGLFTTPEQYQQQQLQTVLANRMAEAKLSPEERANYFLGAGIDRAAQGVGGLMGVQDPAMKLMAARQQALQGLDPSDPQSMIKAAQQLAQVGDQQGATELANAARAAQLQLAKANQENTAAQKNLREAIPAAIREYQLAKAEGYKGSFVDFQTALKKAGATNISLSANADKSYGSQFGEGIAKSDLALRDAAMAAPDIINSIEQQRALLDSGKVYTGVGANAKLNVLAFGQALGATGSTENEIIANTQQLQQQRSKSVLSQVKASGLGTGQGFTDKDLAFLERASAGNISLSTETIKRQLEAEEHAAKAIAKQWNSRVQQLPTALSTSMGLSPVQTPAAPFKASNQIPTNRGFTGNSLIDKYLVTPTQGK